MPKYIVASTIHHDGKEYVAGQAIDLSAKQAAPSIKVGAVMTEQQFAASNEAVKVAAQVGDKLTAAEQEIKRLQGQLEQAKAGRSNGNQAPAPQTQAPAPGEGEGNQNPQ